MKPSLSSCEAIVIPTEPLCGLTVPIKTQRVPLHLYRKSSHIYFQFVLKKEKDAILISNIFVNEL